jgi:methylenetetrahydrofolate dehydrogenase (NADP+)/methenyltetrahydrofolate cyclohydrolase
MSSAVIIDGNLHANLITQKLATNIATLASTHDIRPGLGVILVGADPASQIYVDRKVAKAQEVGVKVELLKLPGNIKENQIKGVITGLNKRSDIHGILVQLPLPDHVSTHRIINAIDPIKDVDGFTVHNVGLLHTQQAGLLPATPQGCLMLIKACLGENLAGKRAVVLGRSQIVGRPMASMLINENCTVTLVHSMSIDIRKECKEADIVVSAIGRPSLINAHFIKPGACVIDVGITRTPGGLKGDVDFASVVEVAGFLTPVPGGVGPMTVACMLRNTFMACLMQNNLEETDL